MSLSDGMSAQFHALHGAWVRFVVQFGKREATLVGMQAQHIAYLQHLTFGRNSWPVSQQALQVSQGDDRFVLTNRINVDSVKLAAYSARRERGQKLDPLSCCDRVFCVRASSARALDVLVPTFILAV